MPFAPPPDEPPTAACRIPASLQRQLRRYRRHVWTIKMIEAVAIPLVVLAAALLVVGVLDRRWDTPAWVRTAMLTVVLGAALAVPVTGYRWIWRRRHPQQVARLLGRKLPHTGDALLGVIELAGNAAEQARSPVLCQAAIDQVARQSEAVDFRTALPASRHRVWLFVLLLAAVFVGGTWGAFPAASANAWRRLLVPWRPVPRYTFARVDPLPNPLVLPHGEAAELSVGLQSQSRWRPRQASLQIGDQRPLVVPLSPGGYRFPLPPQIAPATLRLRVGDVTEQVVVQPTLRPELVSMWAHVAPPAYLGHGESAEQDARGGSVTVVKGSQLRLTFAASRPLATAQIDGRSYAALDGAVMSRPLRIEQSVTIPVRWQDTLGLAQQEPFRLQVRAVDDLAPTLLCEGLPQKAIVLDSEQLTFRVRAEDDFGIRRVGMQWQSAEGGASSPPPAEQTFSAGPSSSSGQRPLAAGGATVQQLTASGAFCAAMLGIAPRTIQLRIWVEDYLPGRPRVYSPPFTLQVVDADEHALWLADQLGRWYSEALEVRDRELQLHETNRQLRDLPVAAGNPAAARQRIEQQAADERDNGRRLADITRSGQQLLLAAARNPEMEAESLERWAATLQMLQEIADDRMPSVADLLRRAAAERADEQQPEDVIKAVAGQNRAATSPATADDRGGPADAEDAPPAVPRVVDVESTASSPLPGAAAATPQQPSGPQRLGLAGTTLLNDSTENPQHAAAHPSAAPAAMDQAVDQQQQLLEEFDKVADQLSALLANLEGSTLVKRLKAASRKQYRIATGIAAQLQDVLAAVPGATDPAQLEVLKQLASEQTASVREVSLVMDDMQAYVDRRRQAQVQVVLADMRQSGVLDGLRTLAEEIPKQQGLSLADSEYWSDALDRWAENLVAPAASGQAPGAPPSASLPPAVVLQVLRVLQAEVDLRESTRVAQQARDAQPPGDYRRQALRLASNQSDVRKRLQRVVDQVSQLPGGQSAYANDLRLLKSVLPVMQEAAEILAMPETGPPAVAAQTEAIELLLKSNRVNPGAGGGGGGEAGSGGGGGPEPKSPLALVGAGINQHQQRQSPDTPQSIGTSGAALPEEFRAGLDEYFNRLDP